MHNIQSLFVLKEYFRTPSDYEPFTDIFNTWMKDEVFAEQRLAGLNTMSLQRVVLDDSKYVPHLLPFYVVDIRCCYVRLSTPRYLMTVIALLQSYC